jgi:hypothetical protein
MGEPVFEEQTIPVMALHDEDGEHGYRRVARVARKSEQFAQLCDMSREPREKLGLCLAHAFSTELCLDVHCYGHESCRRVEGGVRSARPSEKSPFVLIRQAQAHGEVDPAVGTLCALAEFWEVEGV